MNLRRSLLVLAAVIGLAAGARIVAAQEHPKEEHPKGTKAVSKSTLEKSIKDQIAEKSKANGGKFAVDDAVLKKTWQLELVRVHTEKLTQLDEKTYFACVDFKADDGTPVDVDFYMKDDGGKLTLSDTTVHKVNGKARFNYEKKGNYWERVPVS